MDLPNLLNKLKAAPEEIKKFIAVEIDFDAVKTAIWQSTGSHTEVVSTGSIQSWTPGNINDLVTAVDTSLADAEGSDTDEPNQVIFGLPETWADGDGIAEEKKPLLKTISSKLGLKPLGFVISTEAIVHHLRDVEGGPPSAILIRIATAEVAVSLVYLGKLESTQVIGRSTNIAADVEEGLARIPHTGHLPSRMILFTNLDDIETIKQELISYDWQKKLEFLHFPKIESLPKEWSIKAVAVAGGGEVIEALGFANVPVSASIPSARKDPIIPPPVPEPIPEPINDVPINSPLPREMASVSSQRVLPPQSEEKPLHPFFEAVEVEDEPVPDFGFKAVSYTEPPKSLSEPEVITESTVIPAGTDNVEHVSQQEFSAPQPVPTSRIDKPKNTLLLGFGSRMKAMIQRPTPKFPVLPFTIAGIILLVIAGLGFSYVTFPGAIINAYVGLNPYQQQLTFTVDPSAIVGSVQNGLVVPGKKVTLNKTGSKTVPTTGTRLVGDKAKGKVTVYNRSLAAKTLTAGTMIKSNSLKFALDTTITVASASSKENADYSVTTDPSKTEVLVTAADIGEQYNLGKDTEFQVSNVASDTLFAVAANAFSGGSAQKVAAVAKEDSENLKKALIQELQTQISQSTDVETDQNQRQVNIGEPVIGTEKYSAKVGEEAKELALDLSMTQTAYQYDVAEVSLMAQQAAAASLPPNVNVQPNSTQVNILNTTMSEDDKAVITAQVLLQYIPKIEADQYINELRNVSVSSLDTKLKAIPGFNRYSLDKKYLIFGRLPFMANQIKLRIMPAAKE